LVRIVGPAGRPRVELLTFKTVPYPARVRERLPAQPRVSAVNTLRIDRVTTTKLRIVFANDLPAYSGMTELVIRSERPR
jgi:hypothetical protein